MEIKTKFNVGDKIYVMHKNAFEQCKIISITIYIDKKDMSISYTTDLEQDSFFGGTLGNIVYNVVVNETEAFRDKYELIIWVNEHL